MASTAELDFGTLGRHIKETAISVAMGPWHLRRAVDPLLEEQVKRWSKKELHFAKRLAVKHVEEEQRKLRIVTDELARR